jgi:hypothetical protein
MPTVRKPRPIQSYTPSPWADQYVRFVELVATTAPDQDAAIETVTLAFGCMAHLANIGGDAYTVARNAAIDYVCCLYWRRLVVRASNVRPQDLGPHQTVSEALVACGERRATLWDALKDVRPSLALT